mmetsp:Transcript_49542/g.150794  ORF Transcript_49542/g.150794 Transcript_49542/m.150794 type:complete len:307 (-) Transcript_49542:20-940(-)
MTTFAVIATIIVTIVIIAIITVITTVIVTIIIRLFVSAKSVWRIREVYDAYEMHMYGQESGRHFTTTKGYRRGFPEFFQADLFHTLDAETKESVCSIPLSRPDFAGLILFIWTLTCIGELRASAELFQRLVWNTGRATERFVNVELLSTSGHPVFVLQGFGRSAKALVVSLILIPRVVITCVLLELGSRWLLATDDFESLMLNGVALAFIKDMKDLVYSTLVSTHDKRELELTQIALSDAEKRQRTTIQSLCKATCWGILAVIFVWSYIFCFQPVLPDYQWDVHRVCGSWMMRHYFKENDAPGVSK